MNLEVRAIEVIAIGGGLVSKFTPTLRALNGFTSGFARFNLRDVLAVGKINNTDETCNHSELPLFLTLILYHISGEKSIGRINKDSSKKSLKLYKLHKNGAS